jgi:hypothetical protein
LPEATPNFAKDLYVGNAARSPEGDMVTLMSSSDHNFKKYLTTREPVDGYSIAQIEWSEDVGKTKVTISKDGKFATLTFNQSLLSQSASAGRPVANQMPPRGPIIPSPGADQASRAHMRAALLSELPKSPLHRYQMRPLSRSSRLGWNALCQCLLQLLRFLSHSAGIRGSRKKCQSHRLFREGNNERT